VNITKEQKGDELVISFVGIMREGVELETLVGPLSGKVRFNCKGIQRINSVGVKNWVRYFESLKKTSLNIVFEHCSPAIVEQVNMISNFLQGYPMVSVYVPFACTKCGSELVGHFEVEALKKLKFEIPTLNCTKCGGVAEFDDIPEEYFNFLILGNKG
jgi:hypothetical protein